MASNKDGMTGLLVGHTSRQIPCCCEPSSGLFGALFSKPFYLFNCYSYCYYFIMELYGVTFSLVVYLFIKVLLQWIQRPKCMLSASSRIYFPPRHSHSPDTITSLSAQPPCHTPQLNYDSQQEKKKNSKVRSRQVK